MERPAFHNEAHLRRLRSLPGRWSAPRDYRRGALRDAVAGDAASAYLAESAALNPELSRQPSHRRGVLRRRSTRCSPISTSSFPICCICRTSGRRFLTSKNLQGPPDLVIEILSPSTKSRDMRLKRALYERVGVREYWIVDPERNVVEVNRSNAGTRLSRPSSLPDRTS